MGCGRGSSTYEKSVFIFGMKKYSVLFRDNFKSLHGRVIYVEITRRTLSKNKIVMTNNVYAHGLTFDYLLYIV